MCSFLCRFLLLMMTVCCLKAAQAVEPVRISMTPDRWAPMEADSMGPRADIQFARKEGFPEGLLMLKAGTAALQGLTFRDGTIDFDYKPLAADMPGIQFRDRGQQGHEDGEEVYLRMFGECRASNDCIQYTPMIHGFMLWDVYPQYQSQAFVLDGWNHVQLVVSGHRMLVYVNGQPRPVLSIGHLESGSLEGSLKLRGPAVFANLTVQPGVVGSLPSTALADSPANYAGMVRHWQVSSLAHLKALNTPAYSTMPTASEGWTLVEADHNGLLNLNRLYQLSKEPPAIGWLRFTVQASHAGERRVAMGWLGEAWVYVNGQPVTQGKNFYYPESERRAPDGRLSLENGSFDLPLRQGSNEIAIALYASTRDSLTPRTQYGWGLMLRFADAHGLSFSK